MKPAIIRSLCLIVSAACLGLGYILAGHWLILAVLAGMVFIWFILGKWSVFGSASIVLFVYISLAAIGVLMDISLPLLIGGSTAALAAWDLSLFAHDVLGNPVPDAMMERHHLGLLAAACGIGLPLAFISSFFYFQIPFGLIYVLALLAAGGLIWGLRRMQKSPTRRS